MVNMTNESCTTIGMDFFTTKNRLQVITYISIDSHQLSNNMSNVVSPMLTGVCLTMTSKETFLQYFLVILKRRLQNY